ncbi:hypothetical protein [Pseudomonas sp. TH31]|uniref:hypothetical protein n=1 Tax=Pseudomonas sp. TH31 TaxID=2796396 RepID=UPI001913B864|nr:hypothetical protein [Pseudomonas sp. TH31]MBK5413455.1 hypothetical protein [Pseudomonas sp. TH31]
MLSYEITDDTLYFSWSDDETIHGFRCSTLAVPSCFDRAALIQMAEGIKSLCLSNAKTSYRGHFRSARNIFSQVKRDSQPFPPEPENWDNFVLSHYGNFLTDSRRKYKTRIDHWSGIAFLYKKLQCSGFIPSDVYIPNEKLSSNATSDSNNGNPLGHQREKPSIPKDIKCLLPKKYLIEDGLSLNDDAYLLNLKKTLDLRAGTVIDCCVDYWEKMLRCHEKGRVIIESISIEEIEDVLSSGCFRKNGKHIADPSTEDGMRWFLAAAHYYLNFTDELPTLTYKELEKIPFFYGVIQNSHTRPKITSGIWRVAQDDGIENNQVNETFNRLLGNLSPRDCAVACAIIITENPTFNPTALGNVKLYTQNGKFYLRGNSDTKRITLSVSKPRGRERKVSVLPSLSKRIVQDVIRCTRNVRKRLLDKKKSGCRKLFLISTRNQVGSNPDFTKSLSTNPGLSLYDIYTSQLKNVGITPPMVNLYRLRCTQGILEFLRTGSLQAVADLLGNSVQVVEAKYIPKWMVHRWNTRLLRVLHQKLILVSTEGSPWQQDASDFETREDLENFIRKVLQGLNRGDALSEAIRSRLGHYAADPSSLIQMFVESEILFQLCPKSLAAIYAYADVIEKMPREETMKIDPGTDLPLWVYVILKKLFTQTANLDFNTASNAEIAIADRIGGDSLSLLKKAHAEAQNLAKKFQPLIEAL